MNRGIASLAVLALILGVVLGAVSQPKSPLALGAGTPGALCANAPGGGSVVCPGTTATTVYNPTHYAQKVGTTATYEIRGATDASTSNAPCSSSGQVNVIIKSTPLGNTTVCGTLSGTTIAFSFTAPANGCMTTNVAYNSNGNGATNDIISDGVHNNTPTSAAGIGYVDASGNPINACSTVKKDPSVVTELHTAAEGVITVGTGTVPLGTTVHDKATVTGDGITTPTGTVTFTFYSTGNCTLTGAAAGTVNLVSGIAHPSNSQGPLAAGSYSFSASYSGDNNYNAKDSDCEPFTVNKAELGITTDIHNASHGSVGGATHVALGSIVHDTAAVTGGVSSFTLPAVSFKFFTGTLTCNNTGADVALDTTGTGADAIRTVASAALAAGDYSYQATVASNDNYTGKTSACEPLTVDKATLTLATDIHLGPSAGEGTPSVVTAPVALGSTVHDSASVTGIVAGFALTNSVTFKFFSNGTCTGEGAIAAGSAAIVGSSPGIAHPSSNEGPLAAGSYAFQASLNGDSNYIVSNDGKGPCEPLTVDKADLNISTDIHNASHGSVGGATHVTLGSIVHDTAAVTGGVSSFTLPAVSFKFFTGTLDCDNTGANAALGTPGTGADAIRTVDSAALAAGKYSYQATVASNDNYNGKTSACEPLTVDKAQLSVTTDIHNASHQSVTSVEGGSTVHDTATVTGGVSPFALPAVSFKFFTGASDCTNGTQSDVATNGTEGGAVKSADKGPLTSGLYAFQGSVASNDNYIGATSPCEPLTVRSFGKTQGFWGNRNGQALLTQNNAFTTNKVTLGGSPRSSVIDSAAKSLKIFPNQLNACGKGSPVIYDQTSSADCTLSSGLNKNSLNVLTSQTLALWYNIKFIPGYSGQTIAILGCTGSLTGGLTGTSTVENVRDAANALIAGSASGGSTTQAQGGPMNDLLGCLNRES